MRSNTSIHGFTLVEVLVALFIFVLSFVALSANAMNVFKYQRINEERFQSLLKANFVMQNLMAKSFSDSCLSIGNHSCANDNGSCCGINFKGDNSISWQVLDGPDTSITKKLIVNVQFQYQDYQGNLSIISIKGEW